MVLVELRHVAATLLHPRYRSLKTLSEGVKRQCYEYVRRQVKLLRDKAEIHDICQQQTTEPSKKKLKNDQSLFSRFESGDLEEETKQEPSGEDSDEYQYDIKKADELDRYLLFEFDKSKQSSDPLHFWKLYENQFPFLSKCARSIHSIPATTTSVEREFSTAAWTINERRTNLKPEQLDNILLVRSVEKNQK
jgi:hypothetical protein